jgi:hypothetical protein
LKHLLDLSQIRVGVLSRLCRGEAYGARDITPVRDFKDPRAGGLSMIPAYPAIEGAALFARVIGFLGLSGIGYERRMNPVPLLVWPRIIPPQ